MAKKMINRGELPAKRPQRAKLTREETLKRMREFAKRKEKLIAALREGTD